MTIRGQIVDAVSAKPIPGAVFSVYYGGTAAGPSNGTFTADQLGQYVYVDAGLDTAPNPVFSTTPPGYYQGFGGPDDLNGTFQLYPVEGTTNSIPVWVWIAIAVLAIIIILYYNKKHKIFK